MDGLPEKPGGQVSLAQGWTVSLGGMHFGICGISGGTGYTPFADRLPCKPKIYYFKKVNCEERFEQNENCNVKWTES